MYIYAKESYAFIAESIFFAVVFGPGWAVFPSQVVLVRVFADRARVGLFYQWGIGWPYRHEKKFDHQVFIGQGHDRVQKQCVFPPAG